MNCPDCNSLNVTTAISCVWCNALFDSHPRKRKKPSIKSSTLEPAQNSEPVEWSLPSHIAADLQRKAEAKRKVAESKPSEDSSTVCQKCQTENSVVAKFCMICGNKLGLSAVSNVSSNVSKTEDVCDCGHVERVHRSGNICMHCKDAVCMFRQSRLATSTFNQQPISSRSGTVSNESPKVSKAKTVNDSGNGNFFSNIKMYLLGLIGIVGSLVIVAVLGSMFLAMLAPMAALALGVSAFSRRRGDKSPWWELSGAIVLGLFSIWFWF